MYARKVTQRRVRVTIVAVEKQEVLHIRSVSVALVIQHAKGMRRIISSVACLSVRIFFLHYLINGTTSGKKKVIEYKILIFRWFIPVACDYSITIDKVGKSKHNKTLLRYKESKDRHVSALFSIRPYQVCHEELRRKRNVTLTS